VGNTYDSSAEAEADRALQKELLMALNGWDRALRRDECGTWTIVGRQGSIHTWGDGKSWVLFVACRSRQHWTSTKKRLAFCTVTQDCDDEGCLRLHQLPTSEQADLIRKVLGITKRRQLSEGDRQRLIAAGAQHRITGKKTASGASPVPDTHPGLEANILPVSPPVAPARRQHQKRPPRTLSRPCGCVD
jgi:hypothetical protein